MRINTVSTLGSTLVSTGARIRLEKAARERFAMTNKEILDNGVEFNAVNDLLGMLMAAQSLGDMIAETIASGMAACTIDFRPYFTNEDGTMNETLGERAYEVALMAAETYWACWDKESKSINTDKVKQIVDKRKGMEMEPIYEDCDRNVISNKFHMERVIFGVCDYYIKRAEKALLSINADTTLDELLAFQSGFVYITRGCGEQTIDVCKKIQNVLYKTMKQLISPWVVTIGRIKKLESNIKTYRREKVKYEITLDDVAANGIKRKEDFIGRLKIKAIQTMENRLNNYIDILEKETNYNNYVEYNDIDLSDENNFKIAKMIDAVYNSMDNMDEETRDRALAAIYRKAQDLEMNTSMVVKIGIKLCVTEIRFKNNKVYFLSVLGTEKEYKADIYKAAMLFGDIFTAEYLGSDTIEVPVQYLAESDIDEGEYRLVDGFACAGMLRVLGAYQNGTIKISDGKVYALYNPVQELMKNYSNSIIVTVDSYSKDNCRFNSWNAATTEDLDINADGTTDSVGFNAVVDARALRLICPENSTQYVLAAIDNENNMTAAAKLNPDFVADSKDMIVVNAVAFKSLIIATRIK